LDNQEAGGKQPSAPLLAGMAVFRQPPKSPVIRQAPVSGENAAKGLLPERRRVQFCRGPIPKEKEPNDHTTLLFFRMPKKLAVMEAVVPQMVSPP
jgi:hypothetical protein